jgi:ubiquinone/menaquinone biosynthesis C-methylase UbiE
MRSTERAAEEQVLGEIKRIYARRARDYDRDAAWLSLGLQQRFRRYAVQKLGLRHGQTVLDVACGTGLNFYAIQVAIGLFPSPRRALERMLAALRPGGHILITDFKLCQRWYAFTINPVMKGLARSWVPSVKDYLSVEPWRDLEALLGKISYEEEFGGIVYLAQGVKSRSG